MAKKIYAGNYVNRLSAFQSQPVVSVPGRVFYHVTGFALVSATGGTSFDITIPSPDMRLDDRPRKDLTSLTLPIGACVYFLGLRIPDVRKERSAGTATTGLVGTNTNRIKFADALASASGLTTTTLSTDPASAVIASTTIAPTQVRASVVTPVVLAGAETMKIWVTDSTGTVAGSTLTSTANGGTPIIVEVAYHLDDDVAELNDVRVPFLVEN